MATKFVPFNQLPTPVPGDLIEFNRGKYMHWAMYSDEPGYVFNIEAESKNDTKALISLRSLAEVAGISGVRVNNMEGYAKRKGLRARLGADAVESARRDVGKKLPYKFTACNCEYYATKWKYGEGFSGQVKSKGSYLSRMVTVTAAGAVATPVEPVADGSVFGGVVALGYAAYDFFTASPVSCPCLLQEFTY